MALRPEALGSKPSSIHSSDRSQVLRHLGDAASFNLVKQQLLLVCVYPENNEVGRHGRVGHSKNTPPSVVHVVDCACLEMNDPECGDCLSSTQQVANRDQEDFVCTLEQQPGNKNRLQQISPSRSKVRIIGAFNH